MGDGEFVGNASVHWKINHDNRNMDARQGNGRVRGREGVNTDNRNVHGRDRRGGDEFTVVLRFNSRQQAEAAMRDGLGGLDDKDPNNVYMTLRLPLLQRANPDDAPDPEIRVRW
jgi:hypothetical protein